MAASKRSILKRTMELWHTYRLLRFITKRSRTKDNMDNLAVRNAYQEKTGLGTRRVYDLIQGAMHQDYIYKQDIAELTFKGRQLLEGRIGPISIGLITAELKLYWILVIVLFGAPSLYQLTVWLWHIFA